jgi:TonB family protein
MKPESRGTVAGVTELALPSQSGKHPAMRSPWLRFTERNIGPGFRRRNLPMPQRTKWLALMLVIFLNGAIRTAPAASRVDLGSHIPRIEHPFVMSDAQWNSLFEATTPGGKRLSAQQLAPLVLHAYWPGSYVETRVYWRLKIGVFLLNVRDDGTVSSIGILQRIGHPQMDGATLRAFAKWRFRPNSVRAVRVPSYYTRTN